ncbi:hypothetical protein L9W92_12310 [Pelotomaculum terephthalicicum JT]|uniref:hypothetical protein n=1 Tax=Pelotomaculum TaxID=191373 RepID=UPI0009D0A7A7|nr:MULTISPECIES: hypothetical protein [Pelotomaculum]MCG9968821.1 hypothetical protein [Pelotomaculum terephthalicicum JT]OPX89770.1 MAG: hypothetical protein A4E54_00849 [Pelotomaculum sp. PtaB.Bin117]OPY63474.1 MAG: hypothetical protein A4E56_00585 [Pelotomaculum sp. PtaU1.Bin065]
MLDMEKEEMSADLKTPADSFIFNIGLADAIRLTMFGTLISVSRFVFQLPIGMPGHTSVYWMGLLMLGKGLIPKFGAGTIMGIVSGVLAIVFGLGKEGPLLAFKCIVPGVLLDILAILFLNKLESIWVGVIIGALLSWSKLLTSIALGVILDIPVVFLAVGFGYAALLHVIFGAAGGVLAAMLIKRLKPRLASSWQT